MTLLDRLGSRQRSRLRALEQRVEQVESELRALQDSMHRQFVRQNERLNELSTRTQPHQMAQALSREARKRGV
jgi:hypothetical protein